MVLTPLFTYYKDCGSTSHLCLKKFSGELAAGGQRSLGPQARARRLRHRKATSRMSKSS